MGEEKCLNLTHSKERSSHSSDVLKANASVSGQDFTLSSNFLGPFLLRELLSETVTADQIDSF
jgi:hypothetical protein